MKHRPVFNLFRECGGMPDNVDQPQKAFAAEIGQVWHVKVTDQRPEIELKCIMELSGFQS